MIREVEKKIAGSREYLILGAPFRLHTDHEEPALESNEAALMKLDEALSCGSDEDVDPIVDPQAYARGGRKANVARSSRQRRCSPCPGHCHGRSGRRLLLNNRW